MTDTIRQMSEEDRRREEILDRLDVRGEPVGEDPALMNPAERRTMVGQILYSLHRLQVHTLYGMERLGRAGGLTGEECDAIATAGEDDAMETLGLADEDEDEGQDTELRPT